jgi:hypothetical protein
LHFWHSFHTVPNSWHRAAFIFCLCTDPGASPGGLESGVRQFISPRLNHWFFTISTAWFRCDVALEREIPLGDSIARSWLHNAECCGSVLSSVAKLDNATHFDVLARTKHRLHPSGDKVHGQLNTPPRVPGTDLDPCLLASDRPAAGAWHRSSPLFASIHPPHSRCLAPTAGAWHQIQPPVC